MTTVIIQICCLVNVRDICDDFIELELFWHQELNKDLPLVIQNMDNKLLKLLALQCKTTAHKTYIESQVGPSEKIDVFSAENVSLYAMFCSIFQC